MLATAKLIDLVSGKLSDDMAYKYLLEMSKNKPSAAAINELVNAVLEVNNNTIIESFSGQKDIIDCCGTGGSGVRHYNTSTAVSFVLAAGGLKVAKGGNRASSGSSGSFDFLECLGFPLLSSSEDLLKIFQRTNLCFIFAPNFYPSLAKLAPIRKSLGQPTSFNLIGPLLNPFRPSFQILGVTNNDAQKAIADYLFSYKVCTKALVVRAESGLDELDPASRNEILSVDSQSINNSHLNLNMEKENISAELLTAKENAQIFNKMINNSLPSSNYFLTSVILNAGAGFFIAGKSASIEEGQKFANDLFLSGAVLAKYEQCRSVYGQYA